MFDREVGRLDTLENLVYQQRRAAQTIGQRGGVGGESASLGNLRVAGDGRQTLLIRHFDQACAQVVGKGFVSRCEYRVDALRDQFGKCNLELDWIRGFGKGERQAQRGGQLRKRMLSGLCGRIVRVAQQPDAFHAGQDFPQKFDALGGGRNVDVAHPGHVATRSREARHEARALLVRRSFKHDRNRLRCLLCRQGRWRCRRAKHFGLARHQLGGKPG